MKFYTIFVAIMLIADHSLAGSDFIKQLRELTVKYPPSTAYDKMAVRCEAFSKMLKPYIKSRKTKILGTANVIQPMQIASNIDVGAMDKFDESDYEKLNGFFQSCLFFVDKHMNGNFCGSCKGIEKFSPLIFVKQKIDKTKFLVHTKVTSLAGVMILSPWKIVLDMADTVTSKGDAYMFAIYSGDQKFKMNDGFSEEINKGIDIGPERLSSIMCLFNKYKSTMKRRYGDRFRCTYGTLHEDFYKEGVARLVCYDKSDETDGKLSVGLYTHDFDYEECR